MPCTWVACRMDVISRYLLANLPTTDVVWLALLPRKNIPTQDYLQPSQFTATISTVNAGLK